MVLNTKCVTNLIAKIQKTTFTVQLSIPDNTCPYIVIG